MTSPRHPRASLRSLAALACLVLAAGCATPLPRPDVSVVGLEPLAGGVLEQRVRVELRVQNPAPRPIAASGLAVRLVMNGRPLARGVSHEPFTVPALGETTISVVTSTTLVDLLRQVEGLATRASLAYRLEGTLYVGGPPGRAVPFQAEGTLAPPGDR